MGENDVRRDFGAMELLHAKVLGIKQTHFKSLASEARVEGDQHTFGFTIKLLSVRAGSEASQNCARLDICVDHRSRAMGLSR